MEIKTKLGIDDIGFTMHQGKLISGPIRSIDTHTDFKGQTQISYVIGGSPQSPATHGRSENEVFGSEEYLLLASREVKP
jgi:hypothetical protein